MLKLPIDENTKFGTIVKLARISKNLTQKELAKELDVSSTIVSFIERGKNFPSERLYKKMYKFFKDNNVSIPERTFSIAYDLSRGRVDLKDMSEEKKMLTTKLATTKFTDMQLDLLNKFINGSIKNV